MPAPWPLARPLPYPMAQAGGHPSQRLEELYYQISVILEAVSMDKKLRELEEKELELLKPYYENFKETMNKFTDVVPKWFQDFVFQFLDSFLQTDSP